MDLEYFESDMSSVNHSTKKAAIHQVTTVVATSKNVLFPGHNPLLTTSTYDSLALRQ